MAHERGRRRGRGRAASLASDGTGGGPELQPWVLGGEPVVHPSGARLLLADELPHDARPRRNDRVLLLGVVWDGEALIELQRIAKGGHLKAGALAALPAGHVPPQFRLIESDGEELVISVPSAFDAEVHEGAGQVSGLPALAAQELARPIEAPFQGHAYTLELGDRVVVQIAPRLTLIARYVRAGRESGSGLAGGLDVSFAALLLIALFALGLCVLVLRITPRWDDLFGADLTRGEARLTQYAVTPAPAPPKKLAAAPLQPAPAPKADGAEGKAGKRDADRAEAAPGKRGAQAIDPDRRAKDRAAIRQVGLLAALDQLKAGQASATGDVLGAGGLGGVDAALGGLNPGARTGDAQGTEGLGPRGNERGGGGKARSIGSLDTGGPGDRGLHLGRDGRGKEETVFVPGKTTVVGGLAREEIDRVIRRHASEVKHCYEQALLRDRALYGKVELLFQISADGRVAEAAIQESSMADGAVGQCIVDHVKRWAFPAAPGGGATEVSYPYVFKSTGE